MYRLAGKTKAIIDWLMEDKKRGLLVPNLKRKKEILKLFPGVENQIIVPEEHNKLSQIVIIDEMAKVSNEVWNEISRRLKR